MSDYNLVPKSIVDELAQFIRQVDGNNRMGAGSLADKICERFRVDAPAVQREPVGYVTPHQLEALESLIKGYVSLLEGGIDRITSLDGYCYSIPDMLRAARAALATHHKGGDQL